MTGPLFGGDRERPDWVGSAVASLASDFGVGVLGRFFLLEVDLIVDDRTRL